MSTKNWFLPLLLAALALTLLSFSYSRLVSQEVALDIGTPADEGYLRGFYGREGEGGLTYRWSGDESYVVFPNRGPFPFTVTLSADAPRPDGYPAPQVSLSANGERLARFVAEAGLTDYSVEYVPRFPYRPADLQVEIASAAFVPPQDPRRLGLLVNSISLRFRNDISPVALIPSLLASAMPGTLLTMAGFALLRQSRVSSRVATVLALGILALIVWGCHEDALHMRPLISLLVFTALACGLIFLVHRSGAQPKVKSFVEDACAAWGRRAGRSLRRVGRAFSPEAVQHRLGCVGLWWQAHRWDVLLFFAFLVAAFVVRWPHYLEMIHITDEFREVQIAAGVATGSDYPLFFSVNDYMGIVHTYLLGIFLKMTGITVWAPRLYMLLLGSLTVALTYVLAREMGLSRRVGILAAGLMLSSPLHILIGSRMAVSNCTTPFFVLLLSIIFYRGVKQNRDIWLILSGFLAGIALQTHPFVAFFFPAMLIWYLVVGKERGQGWKQLLGRPALRAGVVLFLIAYGNLLVHNVLGYVLHGRVHMLSSALRRDAIRENPLNVWVYLQSLQDLLQNLLSSVSGTFHFQLSASAFLRPTMLVYGLLLVGSLADLVRRKTDRFLLLALGSLLLLPFINQNWSIPDNNRYLFPWLPLWYIAMAQFLVGLVSWWQRVNGTRSGMAGVLGVALGVAAVLYPLFPLWRFYQDYGETEWSSRSLLRTVVEMRPYREEAIPIYVDAGLSRSHQPIMGSTLLKSLEYVLFLDGTACEVIAFDPSEKSSGTFNHETKYLSPDRMQAPSIWILTPETQRWLAAENNIDLRSLPIAGETENRFGVYLLGG